MHVAAPGRLVSFWPKCLRYNVFGVPRSYPLRITLEPLCQSFHVSAELVMGYRVEPRA